MAAHQHRPALVDEPPAQGHPEAHEVLAVGDLASAAVRAPAPGERPAAVREPRDQTVAQHPAPVRDLEDVDADRPALTTREGEAQAPARRLDGRRDEARGRRAGGPARAAGGRAERRLTRRHPGRAGADDVGERRRRVDDVRDVLRARPRDQVRAAVGAVAVGRRGLRRGEAGDPVEAIARRRVADRVERDRPADRAARDRPGHRRRRGVREELRVRRADRARRAAVELRRPAAARLQADVEDVAVADAVALRRRPAHEPLPHAAAHRSVGRQVVLEVGVVGGQGDREVRGVGVGHRGPADVEVLGRGRVRAVGAVERVGVALARRVGGLAERVHAGGERADVAQQARSGVLAGDHDRSSRLGRRLPAATAVIGVAVARGVVDVGDDRLAVEPGLDLHEVTEAAVR